MDYYGASFYRRGYLMHITSSESGQEGASQYTKAPTCREKSAKPLDGLRNDHQGCLLSKSEPDVTRAMRC